MLNSSVKLAHKSIFYAVSRTQLLFNRHHLAHPVSMGVTNGLRKNKDSCCQETFKLWAWKDLNRTWSGITIALISWAFLCCLSLTPSWSHSTVHPSPNSCVPKGCPTWACTVGSTAGLKGGRGGRNEVILASLWAGCPWVKVTIPTRQLSLTSSSRSALLRPGDGLVVFQAGACTSPVLPYHCVNHSFIKHSSSHSPSLRGCLAFLSWLWWYLIKSSNNTMK